MGVDKLKPNDARVQYASAQVRGKTYGYMLGEPEGQPLDTVLLMHGFPDLGFGWRCQIPHLMALGYRVVVPDMVGYGRTDVPGELEAYSHPEVAKDMEELIKQIVGEGKQVIIGGHDWGGRIVWNMAQQYPQLFKAAFSVCTPFPDAEEPYEPLDEAIANGRWLNFQYQLQFMGPDLEAHVQGDEKLRQFFNAAFGGKTPDGKGGVEIETGIVLDRLPQIGPSEFVSADEIAHYAAQYMLADAPQLRGPTNWYRVRKLNWEAQDALNKACKGNIQVPVLFVGAKRDKALPPSLAEDLGDKVEDLTRAEVDAGHWALVEAAGEVNESIEAWLKKIAVRG